MSNHNIPRLNDVSITVRLNLRDAFEKILISNETEHHACQKIIMFYN